MFEAARAVQFIVSTLTADTQAMAAAPGGAWEGMAPPGTPTPYYVVSHQGDGDILTATARRVGTSAVFQIVAYAPASQYAALVSAADRLDALFGRIPATPSGALPTSSGVTIEACYREQQIALPELVGAVQWNRAGGLFRVITAS